MSKHAIQCWNCGTWLNLDERNENDGDCLERGADLALEDYLVQAVTENDNLRAELAALKAGQGEAVGTLHISHFRQNPEMENVDFQMTADLPPGSYKLYTAPPSSADAVSVPRELLDEDGLDAIQEWAEGEDQTVNVGPVQGDFDEHIESTAGYAVRLMKELRALLAQSQEVKS